MLDTYLNDNQGMAYPFYGVQGSLPFSDAVVTGLGVCISESDTEQTAQTAAVYVADINITESTVQLTLCRDLSNYVELVGLITASVDGYYTYVQGYQINDEVFEDQTISPQMLRFVYATPAELTEAQVEEMTSSLQVFYQYVKANAYATPGTLHSTGYLQLGTIPEESIGTYKGKFYLDPSCVTYMPNAVYGKHKTFRVNSGLYPAEQCLAIATAGVLTLSVNGSTACFGLTDNLDDMQFVDLGIDTIDMVTALNGTAVAGSETNKYPIVHLTGQTVTDGPAITFKVISGSRISPNADQQAGQVESEPIVIAITGTSVFPNCD